MATPDIDNAAANPAKASTQAGSVEQHDLAAQIEYDQYQAAKRAAGANARSGIRLSKTRLGGPIGFTDENSES